MAPIFTMAGDQRSDLEEGRRCQPCGSTLIRGGWSQRLLATAHRSPLTAVDWKEDTVHLNMGEKMSHIFMHLTFSRFLAFKAAIM